MENLRITQSKGFQMTFKNGLTISVQFGHGNYCKPQKTTDYDAEAESAEITIWDEADNWFEFENDTVKGWVSPNDVAEWIFLVSKAKNITDIQK